MGDQIAVSTRLAMSSLTLRQVLVNDFEKAENIDMTEAQSEMEPSAEENPQIRGDFMVMFIGIEQEKGND